MVGSAILFPEIGMKFLKIIGLVTTAASMYGVLNNLVTANLCIEFFRLFRLDIHSSNPVVIAVVYGVLSTWWLGLLLGIIVACAARTGHRAQLSASDLMRPIGFLIATMCFVAAISGWIGHSVAPSFVSEPGIQEAFAVIPPEKHVMAFAVNAAHLGAYGSGIIGVLVLCVRVLARRSNLDQRRLPVMNSSPQSPVDFVIITPLGEERDAVLRKLKGWRKLPPRRDDIRVYFDADLPVEFPDGSKSLYKIVVVPLAEMGERDAANATADALNMWRPRFVVLVGIAGGLQKAGVRVGDVLVATQVADYELQKLTRDGAKIRWRVHPVNQQLLLAEQNFLGDDWVNEMDVPRPEPGTPKIKRGVICTGNKVIANDLADQYREVWHHLIGVEMEAGGVAGSAFSRVDPPGFFMIRGVSDLADADKDHPNTVIWREYACDAAATYAISLLVHGPVPPTA